MFTLSIFVPFHSKVVLKMNEATGTSISVLHWKSTLFPADRSKSCSQWLIFLLFAILYLAKSHETKCEQNDNLLIWQWAVFVTYRVRYGLIWVSFSSTYWIRHIHQKKQIPTACCIINGYFPSVKIRKTNTKYQQSSCFYGHCIQMCKIEPENGNNDTTIGTTLMYGTY